MSSWSRILSRDPAPPPVSYIERSGGLFRDMMIHDFDMARFLLGEEPVEVYALGSSLVDPAIGKAGDVDTAAVLLKTASGKICQISNSRRATYGYDQRIEVHGSKGLLSAGNVHETTVTLRRRRTASPPIRCRTSSSSATPPPTATRSRPSSTPSSTARRPSPDGNDGLRAQMLADAATEIAGDRPAREDRVRRPCSIASSLKSLSLEGKVAIVTGSTQGLGEAIAHLFADRGVAGLVVTGRNADRGEKVKAGARGQGREDASSSPPTSPMVEHAAKVVAEADKAFGRVDILVNSAGITDRGTIWDTSPELFDAMFAVNVRAPFFLMQHALKVMKREKIEGSIINIISMSGHGGQSFITAYCASKGALITLTRNVAYSVMNHRIRVNGLTIGWMDTPGEDRIMKTYHDAEDGWLEEAEKGRPFGRLLKPDEVARAVAFLASAESGLMTGSIIDFDQQVLGAGDSAGRAAGSRTSSATAALRAAGRRRPPPGSWPAPWSPPSSGSPRNWLRRSPA